MAENFSAMVGCHDPSTPSRKKPRLSGRDDSFIAAADEKTA